MKTLRGILCLQIRKASPSKELGDGYQKASVGERSLVNRIPSY